MEEYIVTLWRHEDLQDFYDDMETEGGSLHIPDRSCNCCQRRPISRNTKYDLTETEANEIRLDDRVRTVAKVSDMIYPEPKEFTNSGRYNKTWNAGQGFIGTDDKNWALWRSRNTYNDNKAIIDGWIPLGPPGKDNGLTRTSFHTDSYTYTETGKNVDVVVIDGSIDPNHPEVAVNEDGTGGSRVVEIDWNQFTEEIGGSLVAPYQYYYYSNTVQSNMNHGAACASQIGGNRQGHAPGCNLYNIWPYSPSGVGLPSGFSSEIWDYIRAFHRNKPINPETGCKNPTICNASIGYNFTLSPSLGTWPTRAVRDGVVYGNGVNNLTNQEMEDAQIASLKDINANFETFGTQTITIVAGPGNAQLDSIISDVEDCINDGIIVCASASNDNTICQYTGSSSYNARYFQNPSTAFETTDPNNSQVEVYHYQNRGFTPNEGIIVGAISGTPQGVLQSADKGEMPVYYSNTGPGVDIYGWADKTLAAANTSSGLSSTSGYRADPRNSNFWIWFFNGTSSACPNVVGLLTCILERFPDMTPAEAKEYLIFRSRDRDNDNEIGDDGRGWPGSQPTSFDPFDGFNIGKYDNYSFDVDENPKVGMSITDIRPQSGRIETKILNKARKTSGIVYPRQRTARTYRRRV